MRGKMMTVVLAAAGMVIGPSAGVATAGEAKGHTIETIQCAGLGTVDISIQRSENWGAAQLVDQEGHLIPVEFGFTVVNLTKGTLVHSGSEAKGSGHANSNQTTTTCSQTWTGTFAEIAPPGEPIPPGVDPSDILQASFSAVVVVKP